MSSEVIAIVSVGVGLVAVIASAVAILATGQRGIRADRVTALAERVARIDGALRYLAVHAAQPTILPGSAFGGESGAALGIAQVAGVE